MAAFIQSASDGTSASVASLAKAFASNTTPGSFLVALVRYDDGTNFDCTVTDSQGNTWTKSSIEYRDTSGSTHHQIWYAVNIIGGACTVTMTPAQATTGQVLVIGEYSHPNAAQDSGAFANILSGSYSAGVTDNVSSGNWTASFGGELIIGYGSIMAGSASFGSTAAGTGFTIRESNSASGAYGKIFLEDNTSGSLGSVAATFTQSSTNPHFPVLGVSFRSITATVSSHVFHRRRR